MSAPRPRPADDEAFDALLGHVLRLGTMLAGSIVLAGAAVYLVRHGSAAPQLEVFHGEPSALRSLGGILAEARRVSGRGLIQLGVLTLVATPIVRVLLSVIQFVRERDWTYVTITLVVLTLLAYSLLAS